MSSHGFADADFLCFTDSPYSEQLILKNGVIEWNKSRYENLTSTYESMRERYSKYLQKKFGVKHQETFNKPQVKEVQKTSAVEELNESIVIDPRDYTLDELIAQSENALSKKKFKPDSKIASGIIKKLKNKRKEEVRANELKVQQQRLLLMELWNKLLTEQENEMEQCISTKMLKQSVFEKQMSSKMFEVRQQKTNILQNRKFVDDETLKAREEEFLENVFLRDKGIADQKYNYYFEKGRTLELHKRIFAEKQRLKALRRKKLCSDVVDDLVDLSLKYYAYKNMYNTEPDSRVMKQWGNLFVKCRSLFPYLEDLTEIIVEVGVPDGMEEIYCAEIDRQEALDQKDFEDYLNCERPWDMDDF
ncbi:hypothetical protein RN001_013018 [Aquatica leii]|uniref:CPC1/SPEF2 domain-containing protein n=1 Tax=Aquatica leii TaxID=1421715 RepID=A0AAN7SLD4_9COLE|nr:hypothetical protein RN001_013018 [Aquatica leii]